MQSRFERHARPVAMTEAWDPSLSTTLRSPIVSTLPSSLLVMNSQTLPFRNEGSIP